MAVLTAKYHPEILILADHIHNLRCNILLKYTYHMASAQTFRYIALHKLPHINDCKDRRKQKYRNHISALVHHFHKYDIPDKHADKHHGRPPDLILMRKQKEGTTEQSCQNRIDSSGNRELCLSFQKSLNNIGMDLHTIHLAVMQNGRLIGILHSNGISAHQNDPVLKNTGIHPPIQYISHGYCRICPGIARVGKIELVA